eukprot:CAMPEP_0174926402 /NCGR_PEP_ID=MMETSP1355-20121228/11228_1 /TAXON_ID=464990 /ORGANISM="Hemiselmis tepida, Strain CCMP443" /LENGTH=119 /DNA_ID=CAMNT_0016172431 /DNA_START=15 /DNA_END=374 /DNA_ORIENTATION=-
MLSKAVLVSAIAGATAFSVPSAGSGLALRGAGVHSVASARCTLGLRMQEQEQDGATSGKRMGASIDADGKSNVWAVEPKMEVNDPKGANALLAPGLIVGGLVAILGVLAATPLTNPDQL